MYQKRDNVLHHDGHERIILPSCCKDRWISFYKRESPVVSCIGKKGEMAVKHYGKLERDSSWENEFEKDNYYGCFPQIWSYPL